MDNEEGSGKSLFDPVKDALDNIKSGARAGLKGIGKGGALKKGGKNGDKKSGTANGLKSAEKSASGNVEGSEDSLSGVRKGESEAGGLFSGVGKAVTGGKGKGKGKGFLKKGGPIGGVILAIVMFGGFAFSGLSTQIISWKENISSMFGQSSAVINRRSNFMMKTLLRTNRSTTTNSIFGKTKFKINTKLSDKLKAQGIEYVTETDADGNDVKMLVFEDADGAAIPVVAGENDIPKANSLAGTEIEVNGKKLKLKGSATTLDNARKNYPDFETKYDAGTQTFTGKIAGWFDKLADSMYRRIVGEDARNKTKVEDPSDEEEVNKMLLSNASEGSEESEVEGQQTKKDDDGNDVEENGRKVMEEVSGDTPVGSDGETYDDIKNTNDSIKTGEDTKAAAASLSDRAKKVAMLGVNVGCMFLRGIGAISMTVGAIQTANVISYASKYLEIADKIKAGDANDTANLALDNINKSMKTTAIDIDGKEVELEGSVANSDGWNTVFSSKNIVKEDDPSALMVNRENTTDIALKQMTSGGNGFTDIVSAVAKFGAGVTAFQMCTGLQAIMGIADGVGDIIGAATFGWGKLIKDLAVGVIKGAGLTIAISAINIVMNLITPIVGSWLAGTLTNVFLGKNGGFALLSGSQNITNSNLQMGTGRYADRDNVIELAALTKDVETEWARFERATKSPFDTTSKYTFLGSIVNSMIPIANSSSGILTSVINPIAGLTGSSILAIVDPVASAASDINEFSASLSSDDNCAYLSSVGVAGDFACNKYAGAYVDELATDPDTLYENMVSYDSFDGEDSEGNPKIKKDSEYAKYIVACVTNDAQPGTMNGAVEGFIQQANESLSGGNMIVGSLINFGANAVPLEGFVDALDAKEQADNFTWNSGEACTGNTKDAGVNERVRNYSMYNLDQRVLNDMGIVETNSTVAFLEEYYKENPIDNSFEGRIARFSGMTKEQVSDTLALIEYYDFVANYDASERYAFGAPVIEEEKELRFDNENQVAGNPIIILINQTIYADLRNRNFAA